MKTCLSDACSAAPAPEFVSTTPPATADLHEAIRRFLAYLTDSNSFGFKTCEAGLPCLGTALEIWLVHCRKSRRIKKPNTSLCSRSSGRTCRDLWSDNFTSSSSPYSLSQ